MSKLNIPHDAFVFVGDGRKALFLHIVEEAGELLVAMPAPDHGSIEEVERSEHRGRALRL